MRVQIKPPPVKIWGLPALIAMLSLAAIVYAIDPAGDYPDAHQGPGGTLDEVFNVQQGVYLASSLRGYGVAIFHPDSIEEVFGDPKIYLADHPPLGRLWIGVCHELTRSWFPPDDHTTPFITTCARTAPATAFALTVFLVGCTATSWYGRPAGVAAAASLVLMPRLFGHAHLASLETFMGLTFAATVLGVAHYWHGARAPSWKTACLTGVLLGLALLTKIQAVLLPIPIAVWVIWRWRQRALLPLMIWGLTGLAVFFLFWPWLWLSPFDHLAEYLNRAADRATLYVWYFGERFADRDVPWHYPLVMFLTTVPLGLHLLGFLGVLVPKLRLGNAISRSSASSDVSNDEPDAKQSFEKAGSQAGAGEPVWRERRGSVVLAGLLFPLILFSLPGVTVYDGSRLFLVVFPLWAILVGRGSMAAIVWLQRTLPERRAVLAVGVFVALQAYGIIAYCPCHLSYYNLTVGGLYGANRLGLEPTYWGDSITRSLLEETVNAVPEGATIDVAPVLVPELQLGEMLNQSPILRRHKIKLRAFDIEDGNVKKYVLVFRRMADLPKSLRAPAGAKVLAEVRRQTVLLAAVYEFQ